MSQTATRGSEKSNFKSKHRERKKKKTFNNKNNETINIDELMTKEDEEILRNVEDEDGECDIDIDEEGNGKIEASEISGFLKELGISKYRPYQNEKEEGDQEILSKDVKNKDVKKQKTIQNGDDIEIEEAPKEKKVKKKKKKSAAENVEIKDEPGENIQVTSDSNTNEKNKKIKKGGKNLPAEKVAANELTNETEKKPDIKALQAAMSYMKLKKDRAFLLLKSGELWREDKVYTGFNLGPEDKLVKDAQVVAEHVLKEDIAHFAKQRENTKRSEARWLKTVLVSGTLSDKIAALTLLIQDSPVHNVSSIDSLLSMATKKGRREASMAVDTLRDLFLTGLLPDDRKLKFFYQFPLYNLYDMTSGNVDQRDRLLLCWHFEDILKKRYSQFIKIIGDMLFDSLQATKDKAIKIIHMLLSKKPEQENVLLPMLVNKIGDQNINNKASYLMGKLVEEHPNMKGVIVKEICQLLYRPNVSQRAQYYAICFLTQLRLSKNESKLATELIKIYLSFFQTYLKKGVFDSKTMSALLTGVNRAYVYASDEISQILGEMNEVYKILPTVNFQTGVQALMLLYHVTSNDSGAATRFYSALYRKLNDPALATTTKHSVFLNLLFKSMKRDSVDNRVIAFIKRTLQVYSHHPSQVICGVLILLSQVMNAKPELLSVLKKGQVSWVHTEDGEEEEEKFVDLPIPKEFMNNKGEEKSPEVTEVTENGEVNANVSEETTAASSVQSSWLHRSNKDGQKERTLYDPYHRNPLYSRAELECLWELEELTKHFHPTVSLYASMLLKGESIQYNGDPVADYTLIRFLDRFVYKNPKKPTNQTNVGAPQQRAVAGIRNIPVNSVEYLKQKSVPEDEQFYLKYFTEKERQRQEKEDDEGSVGDDEFDTYIDKFADGKKEDFGDYNLDFAGDTAKSKKKKGAKGKAAESESDDDDDDDDDFEEDMDLGDDELAAEFERELRGLEATEKDGEPSLRLGDDDGFNEEDVEFSSDEDDELGSMMLKPKGKGKKRKEFDSLFEVSGRDGKKKKLDKGGLFASAEEFSHLLEEGIDSGSVSLGGVDQMMNKDKSAQKQLVWEEKRDKWINNKGRSFKKNRKGKPFNHGGDGRTTQASRHKSNFGKKRK